MKTVTKIDKVQPLKTEKKIRRFNYFGKDIRDRKEADPFRPGKDYSIRPEAASDPGTDP